MTVQTNGILQVLLRDTSWGSTISFDPGISITLGDTLELGVETGVDPIALLNTPFRLFDWMGVSASGLFTIVSDLPSGYRWDVSQLYGTGNVILVPEPASIILLLLSVACLSAFGWRRTFQSANRGLHSLWHRR